MNKNPKLPYGDGEFDFVTNVVSVDYLVKPQEVGVRSGVANEWTHKWLVKFKLYSIHSN